MFRFLSEENRRTLRQFWSIAKPYWTGEARRKAFTLLGIVLLFVVAVNGLNIVINYTAGEWITAMQAKDAATFYKMTFIYFCVFLVGTPIVVVEGWVLEKLSLHWRQWMTEHIFAKYMERRNYYRINDMPGIDNPDQRLAQDISGFTSQAVSLTLTFISAIIRFCSFIVILFTLSKTLVLVVFCYAVIGTAITIFVGRRLVGLRYNQERREADFRYNLIHIRTNTESIAFYQGEDQESVRVMDRFEEVVSNFNMLIGWQRNLGFVTTGYTYMIALIPALIIAPLFFAGQVPFGFISRADMAFGQILSSMSIFVRSFDSIAAFAALTQRLGAFNEALDSTAVPCGGTIATQTAERVALNDVTLQTPNCSRTLVNNVTVTVEPGTGLLFKGPSGSGKSSLLRAIGGLWTNGSGEILRPDLDDILFLPQRPYMPLGSLRSQLIYPRGDHRTSDETLLEVLRQVNLPDLAERVGGLHVVLDWANVLSLGEQQRLAFARLLIANPKYVILDEATSALDVKNEEQLYKKLQESGATFVSVGHRPTLERYHAKVLELTGNNGGYEVYDAGTRGW